LIGIFSLTVITTLFAIVRVTVISSLTRQPDPSWAYMWSAIEQCIGKSPPPPRPTPESSVRLWAYHFFQQSWLPVLHPFQLSSRSRGLDYASQNIVSKTLRAICSFAVLGGHGRHDQTFVLPGSVPALNSRPNRPHCTMMAIWGQVLITPMQAPLSTLYLQTPFVSRKMSNAQHSIFNSPINDFE
jgi:hypothetical protein